MITKTLEKTLSNHAPILVVDIPASAPSDLGKVRVDWWYDTTKKQASGKFSSGAYTVTAQDDKFLTIEFSLDVTRKMTVAKERTVAA